MAHEELGLLQTHFGVGVAEYRTPAGLNLFMLPVVHLPEGCKPTSSPAIYVATPFMGYPSRLFFDAPVSLRSGGIPPTKTAVLLGRTVYAASIGGIPFDLPPHQAILAHLRRYTWAS